MSTAKKGFRAKKKPTATQLAAKSDNIEGLLMQVQSNLQFMGQQLFPLLQKVKEMDKELAAHSNLVGRELSSGPIEKEDAVLIDFAGVIKETGKTFEGCFSNGTVVFIGSDSFVPGFEEALIGLNVGDVRQIEVTFPENYPDHLKNQTAVFDIKVKKIFRTVDKGEIALLHANRLKAEKAEKESADESSQEESA